MPTVVVPPPDATPPPPVPTLCNLPPDKPIADLTEDESLRACECILWASPCSAGTSVCSAFLIHAFLCGEAPARQIEECARSLTAGGGTCQSGGILIPPGRCEPLTACAPGPPNAVLCDSDSDCRVVDDCCTCDAKTREVSNPSCGVDCTETTCARRGTVVTGTACVDRRCQLVTAP